MTSFHLNISEQLLINSNKMRQPVLNSFQEIRKPPGTHWSFAITFLSLLLWNSSGRYIVDANEEYNILGKGTKQISDINMLLPISKCDDCRKVSYQISAINGCYQWEVSHPNLIDITAVPSKANPECTNIATVSAVSTKPTKSLIWISAKDKHSGQTLRCEVKLGIIQKITIQTHLRQFYLDDYEHLNIAAFDEEGNIFSGLEGFRFEWTVDKGNDKVKKVSWKEAAHASSEMKKEFEFSKMQSEVLFLKGVKQGTSVVSSKLIEPGYEDVNSTTVTLTITEPFVIIPQTTVFLLPTTKYNFQLAKVQLKANDMSFSNIQLPNSQFEWKVDDKDKGDIGNDGVFVSKDKEGYTGITVIDKQIANNTAESSVRVVYPSMIDIEISDVTSQIVENKVLLLDKAESSYQQQLGISQWDNNWILVEGHYYLLKAFIYDRDKNHIYMSGNVVLLNSINSEYFEVVSQNKLKSEVVVKAKKTTPNNQKITIATTLEAIKSEHSKISYQVDQSRMRSEKELQITSAVKFDQPDLILLPIIRAADNTNQGQTFQLSATGGSGFYHWSIEDSNVASLSGSGLLKSNEQGITTLTVKDSLNQKNSHRIQIEVSAISSLSWLEDHLEVQKNHSEVILSLIAYDKNGRKFQNCSTVDYTFDLKGAGILGDGLTINNYDSIRKYVKVNNDLLNLKQMFEDNPQANFITDLSSAQKIKFTNEDYQMNNFGICQQHKYTVLGVGLARVKAYFTNSLGLGQTQQLETNFAEVAVFDNLVTKTPNYDGFFNDLQSKTQQEEIVQIKGIQQNQFILAFGSSLEWIISGGTNFWKDIPDKYQSSVDMKLVDSKDAEQSILKSEKVLEQTTLFQYLLVCQKPSSKIYFQRQHHFQVTLNQQNQVSKYLLRPAKHQISIEVICAPPKSISLLWSQENRTLSQYQLKRLPQHRIINQEKHHYVLVNSHKFIRFLILDPYSMVFYNHSSIDTEISVSKPNIAKVSLVEDSHDMAIANNNYDVRTVQVFDKTGTVYINAVAKGFYKSFFGSSGFSFSDLEPLNLPYEVKDQMLLEVVNNVDVQPKFKSIYLSPNNKFIFTITHGSGRFNVVINNTDIADKVYIDGERTVVIIPKKEGPIEIRVEDLEIPDSVVSAAELLISDINKIEVDSPSNLIEQGSQMDLNVTAYDLYGQEFDDDQYLHMHFRIEIEISQQREKGLIVEADHYNNRLFHIKGHDAGNYHVNAISQKFQSSEKLDQEKQRISSEALKIEVFPLLEIFPNKLLLTPNMRYTLQIVGGPSRSGAHSYNGGSIEINFQVENKKFATVDQFREVTAHEVGDTYLYYEIVQVKSGKPDIQRKSVISKKSIPIRVRLVTSIDIPFNDQRTVYSESMIKMIAILKNNEEQFTQGIAPISYNWNVSNQNVLQLYLPHKMEGALKLVIANKKIRDNEANNDNSVFLSLFNSSTVYTTGGKPGEVFVSLQLAIEYPESYKYEKNWFSKTITVRVRDKLKIDIPEFINKPETQTHLYMMPPNAYSKIETNRKTKLRLGYSQQSIYDYSTNSYQYKDVQTPIISLVNEEGIQTFDKYGKVTVIVEESQAFNDQVVMLNVLITDIYSLASKDVYQALNFPLGSQMTIPLKFQNAQGHQFANNIEGIEVAFQLSHPRVVSAQLDFYNSTVTLKAEGSGECNVLLYLVKHPHIYDIFKVRVSNVVKPASPVQVHVGGTVKFRIMDQSQQAAQDQLIWASSNPAIIDINQRTGEARANQEGKTDILLSNNINAASLVQVSKVKIAEIDPSSRKNLIINTDDGSGEVRVRVKLYLQDQIEELTPSVQFDGVTLIQQNVGLQCESEVPDILSAWSEISELEGFFCVLSFRGQNAKMIPKSSTVKVSVYGQNPKDPQNVKTALYRDTLLSFDVTFNSKIRVESYYRGGASLFSDDRTKAIKIFANTPFHAHVENRAEQDKGYELLKFRINKTQEDSSEYLLTVTVPQEITHDFQSDIVLVHPITNAKTVIPVNYENRSGRGMLSRMTQPPQRQVEQRGLREDRGEEAYEAKGEKGGAGLVQFLLIILFCIAIISFMVANCCNIDPSDFWRNVIRLQWPFGDRNQVQPGQQPPRFIQQQSIRPSNKFPSSNYNSFSQAQQPPSFGAARQPYAQNLSRVTMSDQKSSIYKPAAGF